MIQVIGNSIFTNAELKEFETLMIEYKKAIQKQLKQNRKWVTGRTGNSIEPKVIASTIKLDVGIDGPSEVLNVLEHGKRPGKVPSNFAQIIYDWSIAKGISFSSEKERWTFANAVVWKTIKQGNKTFRSGVTYKIYSNLEDYYKQKIQSLLKRIITLKALTEVKKFKP